MLAYSFKTKRVFIMYTNVNFNNFYNAFKSHDRHKAWSYEGLEALYNYLIEVERDSGQIELDVINLDCEYAELTPEEFNKEFSEENAIERQDRIIATLENNNLVVNVWY
jgi:hypothetical protein